MSPPALSSLFMGCFSLLSSSVSTMLQDTIAVQSLSFSTPTDQTYFVSPSSLRGPLFLHPSPGALSFRPPCYFPVFFVITFHLEVESGGVRQHGAELSWGFILWKTSHLNADGNIFRWFNSTPCNIPNQGFVFFHTCSLVMLIEFTTNCCIWLTIEIWVEGRKDGKQMQKIPELIYFEHIKAL